VDEWIIGAANYNPKLDPEIVDLQWGTAEGTQGVIIDRAPFNGDADYYDDGEWKDQDGYEEASDAVKDLVSQQDGSEWYGEPDYVWFLPESAAQEVTE
jgi:hypothetical protein